MKKVFIAAVFQLAFSLCGFSAQVEPSEISVSLKLDATECVLGERIRGVVDILNVSPDVVAYGYKDAKDRFLVEVYRRSDDSQLQKVSKGAFVADFLLKPNEGQKLEVFLGDHYGLGYVGHYYAKPVLVHDGVRYEGSSRMFDIVPGMTVATAQQLFSNHKGLRRSFELVTWRRQGGEHLFFMAKDLGDRERRWRTIDLGPVMKINKPSVSVLPTGEIIVLHRHDADHFVRSELWSVPQGIEFIGHELVRDPETAGSDRVKELYDESGGVKPVEKAWWEFWK